MNSSRVVIIATLLITPVSAAIGETMSAVCNGIPCVRDQGGRGKVVAAPGMGPTSFIRQIGVNWWSVQGPTEQGGIPISGRYFYTDANCRSGGPYLFDYGVLPRSAEYDGQVFRAPSGPLGSFLWRCEADGAPASAGGVIQPLNPFCQEGGCLGYGAPAGDIESVTFTPPIKIR